MYTAFWSVASLSLAEILLYRTFYPVSKLVLLGKAVNSEEEGRICIDFSFEVIFILISIFLYLQL